MLPPDWHSDPRLDVAGYCFRRTGQRGDRQFYARQARRERGEEYKEARQIVTGDVDHDGTPDTVVLYTIEGQRGSNLYIQFLAVFLRRHGKLVASTHTEAGGKNYRAIERLSIEDSVIRLETLEYTQGRIVLSH